MAALTSRTVDGWRTSQEGNEEFSWLIGDSSEFYVYHHLGSMEWEVVELNKTYPGDRVAGPFPDEGSARAAYLLIKTAAGA